MQTETHKYGKVNGNEITVSNNQMGDLRDIELTLHNGILTVIGYELQYRFAMDAKYVDKMKQKPHKDDIKREFLTKREYVRLVSLGRIKAL